MIIRFVATAFHTFTTPDVLTDHVSVKYASCHDTRAVPTFARSHVLAITPDCHIVFASFENPMIYLYQRSSFLRFDVELPITW